MIIDIRENPAVDLAIADRIGQAFGSYFQYRKQKQDEQKKTEKMKLLTSILNNPSLNKQQKKDELFRRSGELDEDFQNALTSLQTKMLFEEEKPTRLDYYKQQGLSDEDAMLAMRNEFNLPTEEKETPEDEERLKRGMSYIKIGDALGGPDTAKGRQYYKMGDDIIMGKKSGGFWGSVRDAGTNILSRVTGQPSLNNEEGKEFMPDAVKQESEMKRYNYYRTQGLNDDQAMQATLYEFGAAARPLADKPAEQIKTERDELKALNVFSEDEVTKIIRNKYLPEEKIKDKDKNKTEQLREEGFGEDEIKKARRIELGLEARPTAAAADRENQIRQSRLEATKLSDFVKDYPQAFTMKGDWADNVIHPNDMFNGLVHFVLARMDYGEDQEMAIRTGLGQFKELVQKDARSVFRKYPSVNFNAVESDLRKTFAYPRQMFEGLNSADLRKVTSKPLPATSKSAEKTPEASKPVPAANDDELLQKYLVSANLDPKTAAAIKVIVSSGTPEQKREAIKRLKEKYGSLN